MRRRLRYQGTVIAVLAALAAGPLAAQSLDYGELETLFGEPVTLSATGKPQRASEVPATMEIITADEIRRSGATDIPGILRRLPGVDVYASALNGSDVSIRGYTIPMNGRVLVLVDGRQIYNDGFGFISWGLLPVELDEIRQIEVIKGPQSALYGFNAAAGVINILTFDPLDAPASSARMTGGSRGFHQESGVVTAKVGDRAAVRFSAGGLDARASGDNPDRYGVLQGNVDPRRRSLHLDGSVRFEDDSRLGVSISRVTGRERRLNWDYFLTDMRQQVDSIRANYSAETAIGLISALAYHNQFHTDVGMSALGNGNADNSATVASLQDLFKIGSGHSIRLAAEYRRNQATVLNNPAATLQYQVFSGSGMWDWAISERLSLTNAVRYDLLRLGRTGPATPNVPLVDGDFDRSLKALSFNSGLVWRATDADTMRLTAARGLELPSLSNFSAMESSHYTPMVIYGNPNLNPTEVWNYELSWDHALPRLAASTRTSLFYQNNKGIIDYAPNPTLVAPGLLLEPTANYNQSQTVGLELGIKGKIDSEWSWGANYTIQTIWDNLEKRSMLLIGDEQFSNRTPKHKINARVGYTSDPWEVDLDLHYLSRYALPDIRPYFSGNSRAMSELGDFVMLAPRLGYHLTSAVTAEISAQGLWRRQELPLNIIDPMVLVSLSVRW